VLSEYSSRISNSGVVRRLGYLCDLLGVQVDLPEIDIRNYLYLDPTMPKRGERDGRWGLILNVELGGLE
jgi:predicted transcriptional regulator of viral defense system